MARQARIESSTEIYHIVLRGNNRKWIFEGDNNKRRFLKLLNKQVDEEMIDLLAWCIMDNHVHLVIKAGIGKLNLAMRRINTAYAVSYNIKNKLEGHVFQDRFKSQPIEDDTYLLQVIRYIHNNPVKARMISKVEEYEWSSYNTFLSQELLCKYKEMIFVMDYFNNRLDRYKEFHLSCDFNTYLDTKEDTEDFQNHKIELILKEIADKYGVTNGYEIVGNPVIKKDLIEQMIVRSGLSLRKISSYLEVSYNSVQLINSELYIRNH